LRLLPLASSQASCFPHLRPCFRATSNQRPKRVKPMLVDSHCHLDFPAFADDLDGIVARAAAAGIERIVTISTRVRRLGALLDIAGRYPNVYCSIGTHPHHADEEDGISADDLSGLTRHPKVVALGEAGLDYFYQHGSRQAQERGF